jgi:hypothetical protein
VSRSGCGHDGENKHFCPTWESKSRDSSVDIETGYGLGDRGSIPGRGKICLYSTASCPALGPKKPPIQGAPRTFTPGVKRPGREFDHSPPCSAKVKNGRAVPPLPDTSSWRGV